MKYYNVSYISKCKINLQISNQFPIKYFKATGQNNSCQVLQAYKARRAMCVLIHFQTGAQQSIHPMLFLTSGFAFLHLH